MSDVSKHVASMIKKFRKSKGLTQKELGEMVGVKHNTISSYESGTNEPEQDMLFALSKALGVNINDLFPRISDIVSADKTIKVPVLGAISCDDPITAEENIAEYKKRLIDNLPSGMLFYLKAQGDSMSPVIADRSYVLCRQQNDVENGEIAAILINGEAEATLKKVRKLGDSVLLDPINREYEPYIVNKDNPPKIIGKAIEVSNKL